MAKHSATHTNVRISSARLELEGIGEVRKALRVALAIAVLAISGVVVSLGEAGFIAVHRVGEHIVASVQGEHGSAHEAGAAEAPSHESAPAAGEIITLVTATTIGTLGANTVQVLAAG